jgi:AcrR family transcriptional regulator
MAGVRERVRLETTAEIIRLAREQMAHDGASALSLRAVARDMGMVSSAIYRYYASRDELLTALIIDSYDRLGAAASEADAGVRRRGDHRGRWRAIAGAIRQFAVDQPSEWALLFGTPVPGYAAPQDTIGPASRYTLVLIDLLGDIAATGVRHEFAVPRAIRADLARIRTAFVNEVPDTTMALGLSAWAAVMGAVSLELFGHLHNVINEPGGLFDVVVDHYAVALIPF